MSYYFINTDAKSIGRSPHSLWLEKGYAFTSGPIKYGKLLNRLKPGNTLFVYASKIGIVAIGKVLEQWDGQTYHDEPEIYPDLHDNIYKIKVKWFSEMATNPISAAEIRQVGGHTSPQTLSIIADAVGKKLLDLRKPLHIRSLPEEVNENKVLTEGAKTKVFINAYERNVEARSICIVHYGPKCQVCGMSFREIYGKDFDGIIHVHHLKKLSEIGKSYKVNPIKDLMPVCPNCHAAIHSREEAFTIEEMRKRVGKLNKTEQGQSTRSLRSG